MTKKQAVLRLMRKRWITPLDSLREVGLLALSQRAGELRREGHNIVSRRVKGASHFEYRCYG